MINGVIWYISCSRVRNPFFFGSDGLEGDSPMFRPRWLGTRRGGHGIFEFSPGDLDEYSGHLPSQKLTARP